MAITPSTGAKVYFAFGVENQTTPGVPVAVTDYIPIEPDNLSIDVDMGRKPLETAQGTLVVENYLTEDAASVKGAVSFPIFTALGQSLVRNAAFTNGGLLDAPNFLTAEIYRAGQSFQHAGLLPKSIKWEMKSKSPTKCTVDFQGIVPPQLIAPSITPATFVFPPDQPYVWGHMQPILTVGGGSTPSKFCDNVTIELMFDNQEFYGANGSTFPTLIVPGPVSVKGTYTALFTDTADYLYYLQLGEVPGPMQFKLAQGSHSITWDLPSVFYEKHAFKQSLKAPIVEEISWHAIGQTGNLLLYAVV